MRKNQRLAQQKLDNCEMVTPLTIYSEQVIFGLSLVLKKGAASHERLH
jgi:hypothetical protein